MVKFLVVAAFAALVICGQVSTAPAGKASSPKDILQTSESANRVHRAIPATATTTGDLGTESLLQALSLIQSSAQKAGIGLNLNPTSATPVAGDDLQTQVLKLKEQAELYQMINDMLKAETLVQAQPYAVEQDKVQEEPRKSTQGTTTQGTTTVPTTTGHYDDQDVYQHQPEEYDDQNDHYEQQQQQQQQFHSRKQQKARQNYNGGSRRQQQQHYQQRHQ